MSFIEDLAADFRRWGRTRTLRVREATMKYGVNDGEAWCDSNPGADHPQKARPQRG